MELSERFVRSEESEGSLVILPKHHVACSHCKKYPIPNWNQIRYKCINCADYSLCDQCEPLVITQKIHPPSHLFVKLFAPVENEMILRHYYSNLPVLYSVDPDTGIPHKEPITNVCDLCTVGFIRGTRYKCCCCTDFDCCEDCEPNFRKSHADGCHVLIKMSYPTMGIRRIYSNKPLLYTPSYLKELDVERRNQLFKLLSQLRAIFMTYDDSPLGALPTELKMMIMTKLCGDLPCVSQLVEFAATRDTIGATKEQFLIFVNWEPLKVEKTNDKYHIGYHTTPDDSDADEDFEMQVDDFVNQIDMEINNV